jgi:hypothetical protein
MDRASEAAKTLVIPRGITDMPSYYNENRSRCEVVRFAKGTRIAEFRSDSFVWFTSLRSILVPASVEVLQGLCFWTRRHISQLESVTFEPGSRLSRIEDHAFDACPSLKSITIPASVEFMDALSFCGSGIRRLDVEPGNPFYRNVDDFVVRLDESKLIFYCGSEAEVIIPDFVQIVGDHSFQCLKSVHRVIFGSMTRLSSIESYAFYACDRLKSIIFPSSLKSLGSDCFCHCHSLRSVTFESVSNLGEIPPRTFSGCRWLESISVPASVTHLGQFSFGGCQRLTMITFPADSKLRTIENSELQSVHH